MKKFFARCFLILLFTGGLPYSGFSQQSLLVTLGSADCATPTAPVFSIIRSPLGPDFPSLLTNCDLSQQLPDFFNTFIAYNPKDNKIYINDIRSGDSSKVWVMDIGLPDQIQCPASIPLTPDYSYGYVPNNFEFDNNGNLWSFHDYDFTTGLCVMDNFDVTTGSVLATKTLQFPLSNPPTDLLNGDVSILPNGRMFVVFGANPSRLYEITNYNGGPGNAVATYLQTLPYNTFGLAYINGLLEITGTNTLDVCYFFPYDISSNTLGPAYYFQAGQSPIDNTSIDPIIGVTKEVSGASNVDPTTADITYTIYVRNMGNTILNNVNVSDNLAATFGAANIVSVSTNFVPGFNNNGLTLNPSYNGITDTFLLNTVQSLPNRISIDSNYFFELQLSCRITNLVLDSIYYNTAMGYGDINNGVNLINISDSSNNGPLTKIDPNNNNNPSEFGENIPTPLKFVANLPVHFLNSAVTWKSNHTALIQWTVAVPVSNAQEFEVEYSTDGRNWQSFAQLPVTNNNQSGYQAEQNNVPAEKIYYRIKETDFGGLATYSRIMVLQNGSENARYVIYPNPANEAISISCPPDAVYNHTTAELLDVTGRTINQQAAITSVVTFYTKNLPAGTYGIRIRSANGTSTYKVIVTH